MSRDIYTLMLMKQNNYIPRRITYLHVTYTTIQKPYRMYTSILKIKTKEEYRDFAWNNYTISISM